MVSTSTSPPTVGPASPASTDPGSHFRVTAPVRAFLAFTEVEAGRHADFNRWHQLDHRPANLALPGVIWGERWVKTPDCATLATGSDESLVACHYVTIYWFREPFDRNFEEWLDPGSPSPPWGPRPGLPPPP